jgi:DNA polymerase-3 subunit alpha
MEGRIQKAHDLRPAVLEFVNDLKVEHRTLMVKVVIFDTETTGLPKKRQSAEQEPDCWPDIVSFSWSVFINGAKTSQSTHLIKPENWTIPIESTKIHGITHEHATTHGESLRTVMDKFKTELHDVASPSVRVVAHNLTFDKNVLFNAWKWRLHEEPINFWTCDETCTMLKSQDELRIVKSNSNWSSGTFKWPSLAELWEHTFHTVPPANAHSADRDVQALEKICMARWNNEIFMQC